MVTNRSKLTQVYTFFYTFFLDFFGVKSSGSTANVNLKFSYIFIPVRAIQHSIICSKLLLCINVFAINDTSQIVLVFIIHGC